MIALPLADRVALAQDLWASIDFGLVETDETSALRDAVRRDSELSNGIVVERTYEEVMEAARLSLE